MSTNFPSPRNRRNFIRRRPRGKVKVSCFKGSLDLGNNIGMGLADISESGLRLILNSGLENGQEVTLLLEGREHSRPIKVQGHVAWCHPQEGGFFQVGVKLDKFIRYAEIQKMT